MRIPVVNEQDEIIGYKERADRNPTDIIRVSALWVKDSAGRVLLAQRGLNLRNGPGLWGPAVAGTVEENETYESNIVKETEEEIGYALEEIREIGKVRVLNDSHNYFAKLFFAVVDQDIEMFKPDPREVEKLQWFTRDEFIKLLSEKDTIVASFKERPDFFLNI